MKTKRYCLMSDLKDDPALIEEYRRWHADENIWPDIPRGIRGVGIVDMEIYLRGTKIVMVLETGDTFELEEGLARLSALPRHQAWEKLMSRFQDTAATTSVAAKWHSMERIFKLV